MAKCKKTKFEFMKRVIFIATIILFSVNHIDCQEKRDNFKKIETGNWLELSFRTLNEKGEEMPFTCLEEMPSYPGGYDALARFLKDTLNYPITAIKDSVQGRVLTKFSIDKNGKVCNVETLTGVRNDLDSACIKAICLMPNWTRPKFRNFDDNMLIQLILPIKFLLNRTDF